MSTLNAKVFLIFSLSAICTINRSVLLCNFHILEFYVLVWCRSRFGSVDAIPKNGRTK